MFRLVLVIVSLVVQMMGAVGEPLLFVGGRMGRGTRIQVVCEGDVAIGRRCCFRWCC